MNRRSFLNKIPLIVPAIAVCSNRSLAHGMNTILHDEDYIDKEPDESKATLQETYDWLVKTIMKLEYDDDNRTMTYSDVSFKDTTLTFTTKYYHNRLNRLDTSDICTVPLEKLTPVIHIYSNSVTLWADGGKPVSCKTSSYIFNFNSDFIFDGQGPDERSYKLSSLLIQFDGDKALKKRIGKAFKHAITLARKIKNITNDKEPF